jgi:hypothetical protein
MPAIQKLVQHLMIKAESVMAMHSGGPSRQSRQIVSPHTCSRHRFLGNDAGWVWTAILLLVVSPTNLLGADPIDAVPLRAAVNRALPLLKTAGADEYPKHRDCFSCHNQGVPAVALAVAKSRGFVVDPQTLQAIAEHTAADLNSVIDDYRSAKGQPGGIIRAGYALWTLEAAGWNPDECTDAVTHYLAVTDGGIDHWRTRSERPPSEKSEFTATFLALQGLKTFRKGRSSPEEETKLSLRRQRARAWLQAAKARDTEDRVFRLSALKLAGASKDDLAAARADLLKTQRSDGGWSQLDVPDETGPISPGKTARRTTPLTLGLDSDAYATGSVLMALHLAGALPTQDPAYRRGLEFLVRTQRSDGSWFVKSRSKPFQPYFESGFPHGKDQFISAAATAWAVGALALACPGP